ncbi:MAG TPA: AzlD domain-containing protein [Acidimicrobiales bacterium]|nr:AzlD domain-containing protein [Acidimicrobiales bacterium]
MTRVWAAIAAAGVGTFALRASFLVTAHRLATLPPWVHRILRQIPPAALAALVVPALLRPDGVLDPVGPRAVAGLVAALVAWRSRNVALTLVVGMAAVVVLEAL